MTDLASLGLRIESQEADTASARMDKMKASAVGLENATDSLASSTIKSDGAIAAMLASIDRTTKEMLELSRIHQQAGGAALVHAGATEKLTGELQQASTAGMLFRASFKAAQTDMGAATRGMNDFAASVGSGSRQIGANDAHMVAYRAHLKGVSGAQEDAVKHAKSLGGAIGSLAADAAIGGASLDSMATHGARAAQSIVGLGSRAVVVTGAVGALAGAVALLTAAWLDAEKASLALDRAASGVGRTAGLTGVELDRLAVSAANQGDVSIKSAQEQAAAYVSTGRIGGEMISRLIADGKDLASFLGKDLPDATDYLAKSMGDPSKAAEEMTRQFGLLTQAQIEQIKKAQEAGNMYGAQKILMDELSGAAEGHAAKVGVMTSAWQALAKAASDAWTWMGRALYMDESEKLQNVINRRASIERGQRDNGRPLDARTQGIYDTLGREGQTILSTRAAREAAQAEAARRQAAQLKVDGADAPKPRATGARADGSGGSSAQDNLIRDSQRLIDQLNREAETYGLTWEQLARYNAEKQIAAMGTNGWTQQETALAASIREATEAMIAHRKVVDGEVMDAMPRLDIQPLDVPVIKLVDQLRLVGDELQRIDEMAVRTAYGLSEAFGRPGRAAGDLLAITSAYAIEQNRLAQMAEDGMNVERERAFAQVSNYGDMLSAAKGFFSEGSDGYRALQAAEAAYRVFSFAMSVQAMAMGAAETSASVAQSGVKAGASATAGAARMFEALGPFGFPAVAAMIALLATMGLKGKGGGGGGSAAVDGSVAKSQSYSQQADTVQNSFASSVAQKVDVRVSADRDGIHAYVAGTARQEAAPMVAQGMAAAAGATRAQVMSDLDKSRTYSRGG